MHPDTVLFAVLLAVVVIGHLVVVIGHLRTERLLRDRDKILYARYKALSREETAAVRASEGVRDSALEIQAQLGRVVADARVQRFLDKLN
jgi:hypothetical protein